MREETMKEETMKEETMKEEAKKKAESNVFGNKKIIKTGLIIIIPVAVILAMISAGINGIVFVWGPISNKILASFGFNQPYPFLVSLLSLGLTIVLCIGLSLVYAKLSFFKKLINKIPVINWFGGNGKTPKNLSEKPIALVELWQGIYEIGVIVNTQIVITENGERKVCFMVFIPSSPTPFTGWVRIVEKDKVFILEKNYQEIVKTIISFGLTNLDQTGIQISEKFKPEIESI
ncbi:MAG: hypothetical protein PHY96_02440 [Candidatus Pacebacteria bacterium]|nr:hypothetical protein [Candidatus Paceibacterota bacterium]